MSAWANLATSYWSAGKTGEAITILERVANQFEEILGPQHPDSLTAWANLAASYQSAGRTSEAITIGERVADQVASFGGSWKFLGLFLGSMAVWIGMNLMEAVPFDPYPFILLNLVLSCVAAMQAPVIMMSQNRQSSRDRLDARHDYEINLKAEMEVMGLHAKVDELRDRQWAALVELQERQLNLLGSIEAALTKARS